MTAKTTAPAANLIKFVNRKGATSEVTLRKYLAIFARMNHGFECEHGHEGCAAFLKGPCVDDINAGKYDGAVKPAAPKKSKKADKPAPFTGPKPTAKGLDLLDAIVENEYGESGEYAVGSYKWSWSVCDGFGKSAGGIVANLKKQGYVDQQGAGEEACIAITLAGYNALRALKRTDLPEAV